MAVYPLTIAEVNGTTVLTLEGSALPAQGSLTFKTKMRRSTSYYPGNAVPSTQIMGTQEEVIPLRGVWRDDLLGLVDGAAALASTAKSLLLGQRRCLLTWGDKTRYGIVDEFVSNERRRDYIEWELAFFVDQSDEAAVLAVPSVPIPSNFALSNAIALALEIAADVRQAALTADAVLRFVA